tara:strand:+ start:162 stop:395 length:234 start_codon:yes stop_codon:yes gene_type:complete
MKTIYDRLKPDILASINADEQQFPYTTKALKKKLKNSICWDELSVSDVRSIVIHSHVKIVNIEAIDFIWGDKFLVEC